MLSHPSRSGLCFQIHTMPHCSLAWQFYRTRSTSRFDPDYTVDLEARADSYTSSNSWPAISILEAVHGKIRILNDTSEPEALHAIRIRVVSPTFPFDPESFRPLSFSPRVVSSPCRFVHFPVRPWVVSPTFPFAPESFRPVIKFYF